MNAAFSSASCLAASLLLGGCASEPKLSFGDQLAADTATLVFLHGQMQSAYGDVIELWEAGYVGGPCVRMSEQGNAVHRGAAIIDSMTAHEAAVRRDPGGPAALQAAADFAAMTDQVILLKEKACVYQNK
jgi:hypothetical protein